MMDLRRNCTNLHKRDKTEFEFAQQYAFDQMLEILFNAKENFIVILPFTNQDN